MPEAIKNRPALLRDVEDVWRCWIELSKLRSTGFEANPIELAAIESWCRINMLALHRVPELVRHVIALECEFFEWKNKKQQRKQPAGEVLRGSPGTRTPGGIDGPRRAGGAGGVVRGQGRGPKH